MSDVIDLKSLIFKKTWHVPIVKKELFKKISIELSKLFPPININAWWFYLDAWNYSESENYMDFSLKPVYFYVRFKSNSNTTAKEYEKLKTEFEKDYKSVSKIPLFFRNDYPYKMHVDVLKTDDSGCDIDIECYPFLYFNILDFKAKIDKLEKQDAVLSFERHLKTLAIGLNATEIDKTESNIAQYSLFLGINQNWMTATYALQLQEVSITMMAKEKEISLKRENVERILNKNIKEKDFSFAYQYEAFTKEVKRLYDIEIPLLPMWLRKMRQAVLHEGRNPNEHEKNLAVSATIRLLKELKKLHEAETKKTS